ncbi:MAG: cbb3-type cytochrome oxidase assembly protein CcoS [Pseudomonadales bacterium]|nr:cbb3-type cytochrome oxidase assembly protein CcoS [Pseudomonadales bacterium]
MEVLLLLIPVSIVLIAIAAALFTWAVNHNQFDSLDKHGFDIFEEDGGDNP